MQQTDDICPIVFCAATIFGMTLPNGNGDRPRSNTVIDISRKFNCAMVAYQLNNVATFDIEFLCVVGMNFHPVAPRYLRHRIGQFLEPGPVCTAPVKERQRGIGDEREIAAGRLRCRKRERSCTEPNRGRRSTTGVEDPSICEGLRPPEVEFLTRCTLTMNKAPPVPEIFVEWLFGRRERRFLSDLFFQSDHNIP